MPLAKRRSTHFRTIVRNVFSILASDVVNRATTFVLYALVGRYLGAHEFGQMSLALTLFYTFQVFAVAGLKVLITRAIAQNKEQTDSYFVNGSLVVLLSSLVSVLLLVIFIRVMNYAEDTTIVILLIGLPLIPYALTAICEAVFQAWERMHFIAYANVPINMAKVILAFAVLSRGYGLIALILLLWLAHTVVLVIEWYLLVRYITRPTVQFDLRFGLGLMRKTSVFLGIDGLIALMASLNILLLSKFASEIDVGLYSAAHQLLVPIVLVYQSILLAFLPVMMRRFKPDLEDLEVVAKTLLEVMLNVTLPLVIGLFYFADVGLVLLYGEENFLPAAGVLRIMAWILVLIVFTSVLGQVLVASHREKSTLRIVAIDVVVNVIVGIVFISRWGVAGAALTLVVVRLVDFVQHYFVVSRLLSHLPLVHLLWRPAAAGVGMAAYLSLTESHRSVFTAFAAGALYIAIWLGFSILATGGPYQLKARYQHLWSE